MTRSIFTEIEEKSVELSCESNTDEDYLNLFIHKLQEIFEFYTQYAMQQITVRIDQTENGPKYIKLPFMFITKTLIPLLTDCEGIIEDNETNISINDINIFELQERTKSISCRLKGTNRCIRICDRLNINISKSNNIHVTKFKYYVLPMDLNCIDMS